MWRIIETISSNVGTSAADITSTSQTAASVLIKNTHASQTLYIDADGETATTGSYPIAAGDQLALDIMVDKSNGFSLIGSGASTTYVVLLMG